MKIDIESANLYQHEDLENYLKRLYKQKRLTVEDLQEAIEYVSGKIEDGYKKIEEYKNEFDNGDNRLLYFTLLVHTTRIDISKYEDKLKILNEYLIKMNKKTKKKSKIGTENVTKKTTLDV